MVFCTQLTFDLFLRLRSNYRFGIHPYVFCHISGNNISIGRIMYSILPSKVKISVFFQWDCQLVCKSVHVNPFTQVSKIYSICDNFTFDPSQDQVQIFVCIYANFTRMQFLPMKAKLDLLTYGNLSITSLRHINVNSMLFQRCVSSRIIVSGWPSYHLLALPIQSGF